MWFLFFLLPIPRLRARYVPAGPRPPKPPCYRPGLKFLGVLTSLAAFIPMLAGMTMLLPGGGPEWAGWALEGMFAALAITGSVMIEKSKLPPLSWFYDDDPEPDDDDPDDPEPWAGAGRMTA